VETINYIPPNSVLGVTERVRYALPPVQRYLPNCKNNAAIE